MEEIIEPQLPKIVCLNKNPGKIVCCDSKCDKAGVLCFVDQCNCKETHEKCHSLQLKKLMIQIIDSKKNIPQIALNSFKCIEKIIQDMIEQLSKIRQQLYNSRLDFGLRKNEKELYHTVFEEKFEKINGILINKVQDEIKNGPKPTINLQDDIKNSWNYYQGHFKAICKELRKYFKEKQSLSTKVKEQSKITNEFAQLEQWIYPSLKKPVQQFKILYRASQNNFSVQQFHKKCDNTTNTLVLIKTQFDKVIGGFNANKWNEGSNGNYYYDTANRTFIFSLSLYEKFQNVQNANSILYNTTYGPTFGGGHDITIFQSANNNSNSYSNFPSTYNNGHFIKNQQSYQAFNGQTNGYKHKIKEWEVYQVL